MTKKMFFLLLAMTALPLAVLYGQELDRAVPQNHYLSDGKYLWGKAITFLHPDSGSYIVLTLVVTNDEKGNNAVLSEGKYVQNDNQIIFKDSRLGFVMVTEYIDSTTVKYISGFKYMMGDRIECRTTTAGKGILAMIQDQNEKWQQWEYPHTRIKKLKNTPANKRLASGIYRNDYVFLRFRDNKTYDLYYTGSLISTGKWKQENSSITLEDKNLQCNFYMGLDEKGRLRSVLLPGLYLPEEQYMIFNRIDKFPAGSGDVPYRPKEYEKKENEKGEINGNTIII